MILALLSWYYKDDDDYLDQWHVTNLILLPLLGRRWLAEGRHQDGEEDEHGGAAGVDVDSLAGQFRAKVQRNTTKSSTYTTTPQHPQHLENHHPLQP